DARGIAVLEDDRPWAVYGSIVTEDGAKDGWLVFDRGGISRVDCPEGELPSDARRVKTDGFVYPGLIDTPNHGHWNSIPKWRAGHTFKNRYEWQNDADYKQKVKAAHDDYLVKKKAKYASLKYAEIRALIGGATAIQSTYPVPEAPLLIRNLDPSYFADSRIPKIGAISEEEVHRFRTGLASGRTRRIFLHIAEGQAADPDSKQEFDTLAKKGLVRPGVVVIPGV